MTNKILVSTLCAGTLLLTACGGGNSSNDSHSTTSTVDYSKSETIDLITEPVVSLSTQNDNALIIIHNIARGVHYQITDPRHQNYQTSCESGTIQKNSNGSVTLSNCKNYKVNNVIDEDTKDFILSGTIDNKITDDETSTQISSQYEITLSDFSIKHIDGEVIKFNSKMIQNFIYDKTTRTTKSQYDVSSMENKWVDHADNGHYTLTDYHLVETSTTPTGSASASASASASGTLQGDENGQKFSIKFDSKVEYPLSSTFAPSNVNINITDLINLKNTISIKNTTDGKALISAFANGTSVSGYPKTVDWNEF